MSAPATLVIADALLRRAIIQATSAYLNGLAPDLHPLYWDREFDPNTYRPRLTGLVAADVPYGAEAIAVAMKWAERLGLTERDRVAPGQRVWEGDALDYGDTRCRVKLWCIADQDAWDAAAAAARR